MPRNVVYFVRNNQNRCSYKLNRYSEESTLMAKIVRLEIKNFRCIENLILNFNTDQNLVCLIGRGDSGKTTILEAISAVLSSTWNLTFHDSDFYNGNHQNPIEIIAHLVEIPEKLLAEHKYGLHVRVFNNDSYEITDDVTLLDTNANYKPLLTLKLTVNQYLEPKWQIINSREQEDKLITGAERALFNCYMVSDHIDRHFSWNKGNPLYSLLKALDAQETTDESNVILESLRAAKIKIDEHAFEELAVVTDLIKTQAAALGLNILNTSTTLDFKELSMKDGRISLHENSIPFRLKGKGSKRLVSLAIQSALVKDGGVMLVDEIEQGLEPDRVKQLIRALNEGVNGQIFITTHSREVVTELGVNSLTLILKDKDNSKVEGRKLNHNQESLVKVVRACPEAFFATKIIVCEGATEVGICRALDKFRKSEGKEQMSFQDCAYIDGSGGSTFTDRAEAIKAVNLNAVIFCDSDVPAVNDTKDGIRSQGIEIFDCEDLNCIEMQVFNDLPWEAIQELISSILQTHKKNDQNALEASIKSKFPAGTAFIEGWLHNDTPELRKALGKASAHKDNSWFKRIDHGEYLGSIIFKHFQRMGEDVHLKKILTALSTWIDS